MLSHCPLDFIMTVFFLQIIMRYSATVGNDTACYQEITQCLSGLSFITCLRFHNSLTRNTYIILCSHCHCDENIENIVLIMSVCVSACV